MTNKKNKIVDEVSEYGLDFRYKSKKEQESEATALMEARLERMKNLSEDQIIRATLMQLKLKMEEFIKRPECDNHNYFSEFLKTYIDALYSKRNGFAKDVNITPVSLSQIINGHRDPNDEFIKRLMIHSEKVYKRVCEFSCETWYQIYFLEKICDTISNQQEWRSKVEKHVHFNVSI